MKNSILLILLFIYSCQKKDESSRNIENKLDSISKELKEIKDSLHINNLHSKSKKDSIIIKKNKIIAADTLKHIVIKKQISTEKKIHTEILKNKTISNDTTYYYYDNGKLSVKIAPRSDKQKIWVFSKNGNLIYDLENIRLSYTNNNELFFKKNGSLEVIKTHLNPGASRFWYESETYFDDDNLPLYKISKQLPFDSVIDAMGEKYLWNKNEKKWIKQEIIIENNPVKIN